MIAKNTLKIPPSQARPVSEIDAALAKELEVSTQANQALSIESFFPKITEDEINAELARVADYIKGNNIANQKTLKNAFDDTLE